MRGEWTPAALDHRPAVGRDRPRRGTAAVQAGGDRHRRAGVATVRRVDANRPAFAEAGCRTRAREYSSMVIDGGPITDAGNARTDQAPRSAIAEGE